MSRLTDWAYEQTLGEDYDPIRERYGLSRVNVQRAVETKEMELNARNQEASILGQQLRNASQMAEEFYKQRQRMETDAQLTDAFEALQNANDSRSLAEIYRKFPAVQRHDGFKAAFDERKSLVDSSSSAAVEAAKLGALDDFNQRISGPEPTDPKTALAGALDKSISDSNEALLEASGMDIPRLPDGTPDRARMNVMRSQLEAEKLAPEERQFALDKWRMLSQRVNDPSNMDDDKEMLKKEISDLENLLDPRKRRNRNAPAATASTTIPNDDYFQP